MNQFPKTHPLQLDAHYSHFESELNHLSAAVNLSPVSSNLPPSSPSQSPTTSPISLVGNVGFRPTPELGLLSMVFGRLGN
ncbi:hypothetical protein P8452_17418 [Trifolium repens]|nr:hypothetical protein P8452_17418 [Trifolium repens]